MNGNIEEIVENLFQKIKKLPSGYETSVSELLGKNNIKKLSVQDLFNINEQLLEKCEKENIKLIFNMYSDIFVGLPFYVPFIKE